MGPVGKLGSPGEESEEAKEFGFAGLAHDRPGRVALSGLDTHPEDVDQGRTASGLQDARRTRTHRRRGFPALPQATSDAPYPIPPAPAGVLVVDDEPQVVEMLFEFLTHHPRGFKIETASDGYEALIKLGSLRPALLILDVMMPKLDGIEVCRHLKRNPETQAIRILGVTGYPAAAPELLAAGADAVLTKPLALDEVESHLTQFLG